MRGIAESALVAEELSRLEFERMRGEWDALVERSGRRDPFLRHYFLRCWIDNFAPDAALRVFVARERGRLVAALALVDERASIYGVPVRQLASASNSHSTRFDLLAEPGRDDAVRAVWSHLRATGDFDVLLLRDVPVDGAARRLAALAEREGFPVHAWESQRSPYIPLDGGWDEVEKRTDAHFRANLRRRRRKLEKKGLVTYQRVTGGPEIDRLLEEGIALEAAGWKGRAGTAIGSRPEVRNFYRELAHQAALEGELALHFLRLSGRPVAYQYGLVAGGTAFLPKTTYDEAHGECSPGQLLTVDVLRDACARGLREYDFLGMDLAWKREWTTRVRVHHWLYIFGTTPRARLVHRMKARWVPRAKEALQWKR